MKEFTFTITDAQGIHARPAGMLVKEAKNYESNITITKGAKTVDVTRLMALMSLGIKCGETITVAVEGADEEAAYTGMQTFFEQNL